MGSTPVHLPKQCAFGRMYGVNPRTFAQTMCVWANVWGQPPYICPNNVRLGECMGSTPVHWPKQCTFGRMYGVNPRTLAQTMYVWANVWGQPPYIGPNNVRLGECMGSTPVHWPKQCTFGRM